MRRKKGQEQGARPSGDARITPLDVQQVEFRLAFRGYNERDVDAFLDRVTEDLASYLEEAERLRGGAPAVAVAPSSSEEGEAILARAREEAAEIVHAAEQQAEAIRASSGAHSGDARGAVAPFLSRERAFLQDLGSLVQSHAEEIRQMVMSVRARTEPPAPPETPGSADEGAEGPASAAPEEPVVLSDASDEAVPGHPAEAAHEEPVVVEPGNEPAFSSEAAPTERRERSLRDLFWGED